MNTISQVYRVACREIKLPAAEKAFFMKLLREISVNAIKSRKDWSQKEDFITLFFMSSGQFPALAMSPYSEIIGDWAAKHLPFDLTAEEKRLLWI